MVQSTKILDNAGTESIFKNLINEVTEKQLHPENHYEVAAILESIGWNDERAFNVFGVSDVFELAYEIYNVIDENISFTSFEPGEKSTWQHKFGIIVKSFIRGMIFALPMAISVIAMLTLRFSLWSYEYQTTEIATCIAIGTIFSFLTVGGFMQAIARRGFLYLWQGYYNLARKITVYFIKLGYILTAAFTITFLLFNLIFEAFTYRMMIIIIVYYIFLSAIWFSVTVMYILEREFVFAGLIVGGIGIVFILFKLLNFDIIVSQIIALLIVSILGIALILFFFYKAEKKMEKGIEPSLPKKSITLYTTFPFFAYGFLYFAFLFVDRIIGWSTNNSYMPYIIWFRGEYELGLDFALLMLIIPMGAVEVVVSNLMDELSESQKNSYGVNSLTIDNKFRRLYTRRLVTVAIVSVLSALLTYFIVWQFEYNPLPGFRTGFLSSGVTNLVLIVGLISYTIISIALMNCVTLFSLSQPEMASRSVLIALVVNIIVGFLLSRWIDYYFSVFGLLAGAIIFMILSSRQILKVFNNLDYYIYFQS
jgi:hypothetical protein